MNNIEQQKILDSIFTRGFILTSLKSVDVHSQLSNAGLIGFLNSWERTFFGPYTLWVDSRLNYARVRDDKIGVGILGLCLNPYSGEKDNQSIASSLYTALSAGESSFYNYVDKLSGSFVIIYRHGAKVRILQDMAATKTVYYYKNDVGDTSVCSHIKLIKALHSLIDDDRAKYILNNEIYRGDPSRYLPGLITPCSGVLPLTANHYLSVDSGSTHRFFPRGPLEPRVLDSKLVDEIISIMQSQAKILASLGRPMIVAATGGRDSRVSAATFRGLEDVSFFSFHMPSINHLSEDVKIASRLAEKISIPIKVFRLEDYKDKIFMEAFNIHSPCGIWPGAACCYLSEFEGNAIHIRSTVSEIGRIFYTKRDQTDCTADVLSRAYTVTEFSRDKIVLSALQNFIDETDFRASKFFNFNFYDLFYWEHRNTKWQAILCLEAEMATDVFIPYNNRCLISMFMGIPYKARLEAKIHLAIIEKLIPEGRDIPFA